MQVVQIPVGMLRANCYLVYGEKSRHAVIIDPGEESETILAAIRERRIEPVWILLTHGHGDHIGAVGDLKNAFQIPVAIHREEADMLIDAHANLSGLFGEPVLSPPADRLLKDGDGIEFDNHVITVSHTPGHSPGGVCFGLNHHLFTGDALFKETVGRTDLPGGSHVRLIQSIRDKILSLGDDVILYPGHGPITTVGEERRSNPYLREIV
ncbi:MAG: MBL fold metallo-hydrolase [Candidatus Omnitrophica bacterium]|nr:MBL fold metallo-hydrolase [Candidatus Omnitrophota bacterium]